MANGSVRTARRRTRAVIGLVLQTDTQGLPIFGVWPLIPLNIPPRKPVCRPSLSARRPFPVKQGNDNSRVRCHIGPAELATLLSHPLPGLRW